MPVSIQEVRPETLAEAKSFAEGCGSTFDGGRIITTMSLVAVDDADAILGTALCVEQQGTRHRLEISVKDLAADGELHRRLVDKAMIKLQANGVRKFDIRSNGQGESREFWHSVSWLDRHAAAAEAVDPEPQVQAEPAAQAAEPPPAAKVEPEAASAEPPREKAA